jgi:hypothetical protein
MAGAALPPAMVADHPRIFLSDAAGGLSGDSYAANPKHCSGSLYAVEYRKTSLAHA